MPKVLKLQTGEVSDINLFCYSAEVLWEMLHADICVGVMRGIQLKWH